MQERHLQEILSGHEVSPETIYEDVTKVLPAGTRTPTAAELKTITAWSEEFKLKNPRAKMRQVKRAVLKKFNIQLV